MYNDEEKGMSKQFMAWDRQAKNKENAELWSEWHLSIQRELYSICTSFFNGKVHANQNKQFLTVKLANYHWTKEDSSIESKFKAFCEKHGVTERMVGRNKMLDLFA